MSWINDSLNSFETWAKNVLATGNTDSLPAVELPILKREDLMVETAYEASIRDHVFNQTQQKLDQASQRNAIDFTKRIQDSSLAFADRFQENIDQHIEKEKHLRRYLEKQQGYLEAANRRLELAQAKYVEARAKYSAVSKGALQQEGIEKVVDVGQYNRKTLATYYSKTSHDYSTRTSLAIAQSQNLGLISLTHKSRNGLQLHFGRPDAVTIDAEQAYMKRQVAFGEAINIERNQDVRGILKIQQELESIKFHVDKMKSHQQQHLGDQKEVNRQLIINLEQQAEKKVNLVMEAQISIAISERQEALSEAASKEQDPEIRNRIKLQQEFEKIQGEVEKLKQNRGFDKDLQQQFISAHEHLAEMKAAEIARADIDLSKAGKHIDFTEYSPKVIEGEHPRHDELLKNTELEVQFQEALKVHRAFEKHQKAEEELIKIHQEYIRLGKSLDSVQAARLELQVTKQEQLEATSAPKIENKANEVVPDSKKLEQRQESADVAHKQSLTAALALAEATPIHEPEKEQAESKIRDRDKLNAQLMPEEVDISKLAKQRYQERIQPLKEKAKNLPPPQPWFARAIAKAEESVCSIKQSLALKQKERVTKQQDESKQKAMGLAR